LFTLRVWREALGEGQVAWRGQVQHVLTGQARYFHGWQMLAGQLESMLSDLEHGSSSRPVAPLDVDNPEPEVAISEAGDRRKRK
jgi:hypothetical protein